MSKKPSENKPESPLNIPSADAPSADAPSADAPSADAPSADASSLSRRQFVARSAAGMVGAFWMASCVPWRGDAGANASAATSSTTGASAAGTTASGAAANATSSTRLVPLALEDVPFHALPLGSIRARGWLLTQLQLQRDGLTGHAEEVLPDVGPNSGWLGGTGENWEKGPYYVKGLVPLAYTLDDPALKAKAQKWIDWMLGSQRADGFFGPKQNDDWWPRIVANYVLRDYAEATNDPRVVPFMTRYYRYMADHLAARPLRDWARSRAGDEIDTIFWLYNRTGDAWLLPLADMLHEQAYPWREIFTKDTFLEYGDDYQPKHNVNVPQALKMPPVYWQRSHDSADRQAFQAGVANLNRDHGLAFGMSSGTEFLAGVSSTEGAELCSIVERMLSDETALCILGDATIGDNLEMVAFNGLPAATTRSIRQHVYFTLPNNVMAIRGGVGYNQDYDDARTPAPRSGYPCCCYNFHMGWPKLAQNSWAATRDKGLAIMAYVPSQVTAPVGNQGTRVSFVAETSYPFEDTIRLKFDAPQKVSFPLSLRIPAWCDKPSVSVNGKLQSGITPGTFAVINREWKPGDQVVVRFPMTVRVLRGVNDSVSVRRGPLVYSLPIKEKWDAWDNGKKVGFESFEIRPQSAWNYGLMFDERNPGAAFKVQQTAPSGNPFENSPVKLQVQAKKIPDWTMAWSGKVAFDPPVSPVVAATAAEIITLVPFGSQMLRITNFPAIGAKVRPRDREFRDHLSDGHLDDWVVYGGGWFARDGELRPSSSAGLQGIKAVATKTRFADFTYNARVSVGAVGNAGLMFRVSKPSLGADAYNGYYVGLSAADGIVELGRSSGQWTSLMHVKREIKANQVYRVRVEARGAQLRVWIDDAVTPIIDVQDATFAEGAIGVRQYSGDPGKTNAAFSQIVVQAV